MAESRVIHADITASAVDAQGDAFTGPIRFLYDPADPYAITLDCTDLEAADHRAHGSEGKPEPVLWTFARSLLTDALLADGSYGIADVVCERDRGSAWVTVTLSSPDGTARLRFTHFALLRFIQRTAALVPLGREAEHLDVDAAIRQLLGSVR